MVTLQFLDDAVEFLAVAGEHLAADPVVSTVVATVAERTAAARAAGVPPPADRPEWWVVVRGADGAVAGTAMRTAPFAPHPIFVLPMPDRAALGLARALHERGEECLGVNGALAPARTCAEELARLGGGDVEVAEHTRLFELGELVEPPLSPGRLRLAEEEDLGTCVAWWTAFHADAAEQAGREEAYEHVTDIDEVRRRIQAGLIWLWERDGEPVHLTAANPPAFGVARIGPVFTPRAHRGRGHASAAVAQVSRVVRDQGARVCLFTDQLNPVSNRIYEAIGYRPVVDMANHLVTRRAPA